MNDILMGAPTLEALETMIEEFLQSCHAKNIKLKGTKFVISPCVEFWGCQISADRLNEKGFIFIQPKEGRVRAFEELKRPTTKREAQVWSGMVSSLAAWAPAICCLAPADEDPAVPSQGIYYSHIITTLEFKVVRLQEGVGEEVLEEVRLRTLVRGPSFAYFMQATPHTA